MCCVCVCVCVCCVCVCVYDSQHKVAKQQEFVDVSVHHKRVQPLNPKPEALYITESTRAREYSRLRLQMCVIAIVLTDLSERACEHACTCGCASSVCVYMRVFVCVYVCVYVCVSVR